MALTTYTYSISLDTLNAKVDSENLSSCIQRSSIIIAVSKVTTIADDLHIIFKDSLDSADIGELDTIVATHNGVPLISAEIVKIQEATSASRQLVYKGIRFVADLDGDTLYDLQFAEERELQAVDGHVTNHTDGDYVEMFAVLPGSAGTILATFGETMYVPEAGRIVPLPSTDTSLVPLGVILRFKYHSVATSGPQPVIIAHLRTHK